MKNRKIIIAGAVVFVIVILIIVISSNRSGPGDEGYQGEYTESMDESGSTVVEEREDRGQRSGLRGLFEKLFSSYDESEAEEEKGPEEELNSLVAKMSELEDLDLKGKKIALYGLGDQKNYAENFLDAVGLMAEILEEQGASLVGFTSREGYTYESSRAERGDYFAGLAIDYENQGSMNKERVSAWVKQLEQEFA